MKCINCGNELTTSYIACPFCGKPLNTEAPSKIEQQNGEISESNASESLTNLLRQDIKSDVVKTILSTLLFLVSGLLLPIGCVVVFEWNVIVLVIIVVVLIALFGKTIANSIRTTIREYKHPLEIEPLKTTLSSGVTCAEIYNTKTSPRKKILDLNVGKKCIVDRRDLRKAIATQNVSKVKLIRFKESLTTGKFKILVLDNKGNMITLSKDYGMFNEKNIESDMTHLTYDLSYYLINAFVTIEID